MKKYFTGLCLIGLAVVLGLPFGGFAQTPASGGKIVIARPSDAVSLDPAGDTTAAGAIVYGSIIEPLLVMKDGKVKPHLATKYEIISSTRVRFFLRQGVKFHDGTPFNAEAVKFTFERAVSMPARWLTLFGPLLRATGFL